MIPDTNTQQMFENLIELLKKYNESEIIKYLQQNREHLQTEPYTVHFLEDGSRIAVLTPPHARTWSIFKRAMGESKDYIYKDNTLTIQED